MQSRFEWFVAMRYLRGAHGRTGGARFLRFVTYVGIGGVALGVAALLLSLMIVRGFSREIQEKIVGFGAHVQVEHFLERPIDNVNAIYPLIADFPEVQRVTPVVTGFVLLRAGPDMEGVLLNGLPPETPSFLRERVVAGEFDLESRPGEQPGLVLGEELAAMLGLSVGDAVLAMTMRDQNETAAATIVRPRVVGFVVRGIYETGLADFDRTFAYADIGETRRLLGLADDQVSRLDLLLPSVEDSPAVARRLNEVLEAPLSARSIYQVQSNLFAWVNLQRSIVPFVIGVIVLVAAFNIVGLLLMMILEKTREIGIIRSMGAAGNVVRRLFVSLGFLVGAVGTAFGVGLALGLGILQQRFGIIPLPQEAYYIDRAPVEIHAVDFAVVVVVAMVLCTLAAYIPARIAARIDPVRTIRFGG